MANLGITLPLQLGPNGYFENTSDVMEQIKSNLTNLLLTIKGERVMQPDFGSDLHRVIFQPITDDGLSDIRSIIELATQKWMPFIQINDVKITRDEEYNSINLAISFSLVTNQNMTDSIILVF